MPKQGIKARALSHCCSLARHVQRQTPLPSWLCPSSSERMLSLQNGSFTHCYHLEGIKADAWNVLSTAGTTTELQNICSKCVNPYWKSSWSEMVAVCSRLYRPACEESAEQFNSPSFPCLDALSLKRLEQRKASSRASNQHRPIKTQTQRSNRNMQNAPLTASHFMYPDI